MNRCTFLKRALSFLYSPISLENLAFIGKVQQIATDLPRVIEVIFGEGSCQFAETRWSGRRGAVDRVPEFYDDELKMRDPALYERDFEAFDYDPS